MRVKSFFLLATFLGAMAVTSVVGAGKPASTTQPANEPVAIVENDQWRPLSRTLDIESGSALDFSFLTDGPAGKYGPVVARGKHLVFQDRPNQPVRFFGPNITFGANYMTKEQDRALAERFARLGYNAVRFHHYDGILTKGTGNSYTLNPDRLDQLDYLFHCMKQQGVYVTIDLYTIRTFSPQETDDVRMDQPIHLNLFKKLLPVSKSLLVSWERFAKALLTHRNPYTGMTWGEDPALLSICLVNEELTYQAWHGKNETPIDKLYNERFEKWLAHQSPDLKKSTNREVAISEFLTDLQIELDHNMTSYVRSLGVKTLLTNLNSRGFIPQTFVRDQYELVDNHHYENYPKWTEKAWQLPYKQGNRSMIGSAWMLPWRLFRTRILDKPFTVTEYNEVYPDFYRGESGVLTGAYAAFQDWNGLFRFSYANSVESATTVVPVDSTFTIAGDPISILSDRIASMLFLRGDVAPSPNDIAYAVTRDLVFTTDGKQSRIGKMPMFMSQLGLVSGVGNIVLNGSDDAPPPVAIGPVASPTQVGKTLIYPADRQSIAPLAQAGLIDPARMDLTRKHYVSDTNQLTLDAKKKTFRAITPRTEAFVITDARKLAGDAVTVTNQGGPCTVAVMALDGQPIAQSDRLLVLHLTNGLNSNTVFGDRNKTILRARGELPFLIRRGEATIEIKFSQDKPATAYAIDLSGRRREQAQTTLNDSVLRLEARTSAKNGAVLAYEIVRK